MSGGPIAEIYGIQIAARLANALAEVLADCDRRAAMFGKASIGLSTDCRIKADSALKEAARLKARHGVAAAADQAA